jgi:hypothetical protein
VSGGVSVPAVFLYLHHNGRYGRVHVELGWFPEDPHAVSVWFVREDKVWFCGRELLVDALTSDEAGDGDVQFRRAGEHPDYVAMALDSPAGHAEFYVPREALIELLVASEPGFRGAVDAWQVKWQGELTKVTS